MLLYDLHFIDTYLKICFMRLRENEYVSEMLMNVILVEHFPVLANNYE
jgi:hypothetical protein